jgi:hypothetical protein
MERHERSAISFTPSVTSRPGRQTGPSAGVTDSQSVSAPERGACIDPPWYDAGKTIRGKKRHILIDMPGLRVGVVIHAANRHGGVGGVLVLDAPVDRYALQQKLSADAG